MSTRSSRRRLTAGRRVGVVLASLSACLLWVSPCWAGDEYANARGELVAAYRASDFVAMRTAARKALLARPGYPGALFNLALAQALDEDPHAALATLQELLSIGIDFGAADIEGFAALKGLLEWAAYAEAVEKLYEPVGFAEVVATLETQDFIPEGIAADAAGQFYLGSIRHGELVRLGERPQTLSTPENGHWSVFGMRFDGAGGLWFASAAVPQLLEAADAEGSSGLFRYDLEKEALSHRAVLPATEEAQVLGDLVIAPGGLIYTTDSLTGILYRFDPDNASFERLVERGVFGSPQGLVLDSTASYLYVADYIGGLFRVTLADGKIEKVRIQANVTDYGIDGLYRHGTELVAIQNGVRPNRVVALTLGEDGLSVVAGRTIAANLPEFDEPTLGLVSGDDFFFVANSHWNRFAADNNLPNQLSGPIILRVSLLPGQ